MTGVRHAFVDESGRRGLHLLCAALVDVRHLDETRVALRRMRLKGQRRLHFASESDRRRRDILGELSLLPLDVVIYASRDPNPTAARERLMRLLVPDLRDRDVGRLVLDSRKGQDHHDRVAIREVIGSRAVTTFTYEHIVHRRALALGGRCRGLGLGSRWHLVQPA